MSVINLIADLLEEETVLSSKERALGIWEILETSGQPLIVCSKCGLAAATAPACGHETAFVKYLLLDPQDILDSDERLPDKGTYTRELKALFTKQGPAEGKGRETFR